MPFPPEQTTDPSWRHKIGLFGEGLAASCIAPLRLEVMLTPHKEGVAQWVQDPQLGSPSGVVVDVLIRIFAGIALSIVLSATSVATSAKASSGRAPNGDGRPGIAYRHSVPGPADSLTLRTAVPASRVDRSVRGDRSGCGRISTVTAYQIWRFPATAWANAVTHAGLC